MKGELVIHELARIQTEMLAFLAQYALGPLTEGGTRMVSPRFRSTNYRDALLYELVDALNLQFDLEKPSTYDESKSRYYWHVVTKYSTEVVFSIIVMQDHFVCNLRASGMEDPYAWTSLLRRSKAK